MTALSQMISDGGAAPFKVTILTGAGVHNFDPRTRRVILFLSAGGGGGAGGFARASGAQGSSQPGLPGETLTVEMHRDAFDAATAYACGAGGLGGVGDTYTGTNGQNNPQGNQPGTSGGDTYFGAVKVRGGPGGRAENTNTPLVAEHFYAPLEWIGNTTYRTRVIPVNGDRPPPFSYKGNIGSGGGAGGYVPNDSTIGLPGGAGGMIFGLAAPGGATLLNSTAKAGRGGDGAPHKAHSFLPGGGGGGGGCSSGVTGADALARSRTAGDGGNGGLGGGGGGSGGSAVVGGTPAATATSGKGGNGGDGVIAVMEYA